MEFHQVACNEPALLIWGSYKQGGIESARFLDDKMLEAAHVTEVGIMVPLLQCDKRDIELSLPVAGAWVSGTQNVLAANLQAQEQKLMKLADRLLRLRASGAPIKQRQGLIVGAISAINEIRQTTPHFSQKVWGAMSMKVLSLDRACSGLAAAMSEGVDHLDCCHHVLQTTPVSRL